MTISIMGIIGAGKLGTAIGRLASQAGLEVLVSSRPKPLLEMILGSVVPGAQLVDLPELAERADIVVLAVPATAVAELDLAAVRGTIIDATNPWEATGTVTGRADLAALAPGVPVARTLNHVSYEELLGSARQTAGGSARRAIAVVAEDPRALAVASELVDRLGFDPVAVPEDRAELFSPEGRLFGAWLDAGELTARLA